MTVEEASSGTAFLAADGGSGVVVVKRDGSAGGCGASASDLFGSGAFSIKSDEVVVPETDESPKVSNSALGPGSLSDDRLLRYFTPLDEWALRANFPEDDRFVRLRVR